MIITTKTMIVPDSAKLERLAERLQTKPRKTDIDTLDVTLTGEILGRGKFSTVYKAYDSKGNPLAVKAFEIQTRDREQRVKNIIENMEKQWDILSQAPFLSPVATYDDCCIQKAIDGESMSILLLSGRLTDAKRQIGLLTYANMLSKIHEKGLCFGDTNLGSIVIGESAAEIGICDYDTLAPQCGQNPYLSTMKHEHLTSKDQRNGMPRTPQGDREGFVRMTLAAHGINPASIDSIQQYKKWQALDPLPEQIKTTAIAVLSGEHIATTELAKTVNYLDYFA